MLDAIASLIKLLESRGSLDNLVDDLFNTHLPAEFEMLSKLPVITSFKVSLVNLIRNNELPSLTDLYYTYRFVFSTFIKIEYIYYFFSNFLVSFYFVLYFSVKIAILLLSKLKINVTVFVTRNVILINVISNNVNQWLINVNHFLYSKSGQLCFLTSYLPSANSASSLTEDISSLSTAIISVCLVIALTSWPRICRTAISLSSPILTKEISLAWP